MCVNQNLSLKKTMLFSSNARYREQVKGQFICVVECNIDILINDIDGWWFDSGVILHIGK